MVITIEHCGIKRTIEGPFVVRGYRTDIDQLIEALKGATSQGSGFLCAIIPDEPRRDETVCLGWSQDVPVIPKKVV